MIIFESILTAFEASYIFEAADNHVLFDDYRLLTKIDCKILSQRIFLFLKITEVRSQNYYHSKYSCYIMFCEEILTKYQI